MKPACDPSVLERFDTQLAKPRESDAEFAPLEIVQRRRPRADRVALDDSKFFERGFEAGNGWAKRSAAALER